MQWFAQVQGQIYGPYSDTQMQSYTSEGRITAQSHISNNPAAGFFPASSYDIFGLWAGTGQSIAALQPHEIIEAIDNVPAQPQINPVHELHQKAASGITAFRATRTQAEASPQIQSQTPALQTLSAAPVAGAADVYHDVMTPETPEQSVKTRVCLVMAEIRSDSMVAFLAQLQEFGAAERVGDSVWLLRSTASVETLRNSLSQSLSRQDRLFLLDCGQNKTAWFNIGADLDYRIRKIWED